MKNIIQINKENSTNYLFIDNISSIVVREAKQDHSYKYKPLIVKKYWIPLFNTKEGGYYYLFKENDFLRGNNTKEPL